MAEKLRCKLCGFTTIRCGMGNHLKAKHPEAFTAGFVHPDWAVESLGFETKEERNRRVNRR